MRLAPKANPKLTIVGTYEKLTGTALIVAPRRDENGKITFDWEGGTEVHWDDQKTVVEFGQRLFVDDEGTIWREDALELVDD